MVHIHLIDTEGTMQSSERKRRINRCLLHHKFNKAVALFRTTRIQRRAKDDVICGGHQKILTGVERGASR
jgi:hypothetical protein